MVAVMTGPIYRAPVTVTHPDDPFEVSVDGGIDTCGGASVIRRDVLPRSVAITPLEKPVGLQPAQGPKMSVLGTAEVQLKLGQVTLPPMQLVVADELVLPLILGAPWIDRFVQSISPPERTMTVEYDGVSDEVPCAKPSPKLGAVTQAGVVRAAEDTVLPPMSETAIALESTVEGLAVLRPPWQTRKNRRNPQTAGHLSLLKSGVLELPTRKSPSDKPTFLAAVGNFEEGPKFIRKGQVLGVAETFASTPVIAVPDESQSDPDWEETVRASSSHLSDSEVEELLTTLRPFGEMWSGNLGDIAAAEHSIPTEGPPLASQPYRLGPDGRRAVEAEIRKMKAQGVIEESTSPWASPIVLVPKRDGSLRFAVDYRRVNSITQGDSYALPRMDDCLDALGGAQYFTTLDCNAGYWQIRMNPEDKAKTAFTSHVGLWEFNRMPFGLKGAPATFQRAADRILATVRFRCAITYLDDVVVFSQNFAQHLEDVALVLSLLKEAGVTLKLAKCSFAAQQVRYLGYKVSGKGMAVDDDNVRAVREAKVPGNKSQMRSFLGLMGFYRRFVPRYASVAKPLTATLAKDQPERFTLSPEQRDAVEELRTRITSAPVLALPVPGRKYILETDASDGQLGVVLYQVQPDGSERPVGFWSRQVSKAESNYSITEKEALAVVWGIRLLRPYLERTRFTVRSDHLALRYLFEAVTKEIENKRLMRWRLRVADLEIDMEYKSGAHHKVPDYLSRAEMPFLSPPTWEEDPSLTLPLLVIQDEEDSRHQDLRTIWKERHESLLLFDPPDPLTPDELQAAQDNDPWCRTLRKQLATGRAHPSVVDEDGLLIWRPLGDCKDSDCRHEPGDRDQMEEPEQPDKIIVPASLRERLMTLGHYTNMAGHPGSKRLGKLLSKHYHWPALTRDCKAFVRGCPACRAYQLKVGRKKTTLLRLFPPTGPLEFVASDFLGPLRETVRGNRWVMVVSCRWAKLHIAVPMSSSNSEETCRAFLDRWVAPFGLPLVLLTDNGSNFVSKYTEQFFLRLGVHHVTTSPYHPSANGQVERHNATLVSALLKLGDAEANWDLMIPQIVAGYNATPHTATGYTPFELALTRAPRPWTHVPSLPTRPGGYPELRHSLMAQAAAIGRVAKERLTQTAERYKKAYDAHVSHANRDVRVGGFVWVRAAPAKGKLRFPVTGPYLVTKKTGTNVTVMTQAGEQVVHLDRVRYCPIAEELPAGVRVVEEPTCDISIQEEEFVVERLVSHVMVDGALVIRTRWAGFDSSEDTFEPAENLPAKMVEAYKKKKRLL